jgi:pilus assembly protein CpaF
MKFWKKNQLSDAQTDAVSLADGVPLDSGTASEYESTYENTMGTDDPTGEASQSGQANNDEDAFGEDHESTKEEPDSDSNNDSQSEEETEALEYEFQRIKSEIHQQVIGRIDLTALGAMEESDLRIEVHRACEQVLDERSDLLNKEDRERIFREVIDETFGLGPLEPLLADEAISEIMINGPDTIYVERNGRLQRSKVTFASEPHLLKIIQKVVGAVGRRVDETSPMVDARLSDGSRFNAIIPPLALDGSLVSIRRFGKRALGVPDLLGFKSLTPEMVTFLSACIEGRLNVIISGGTGSGKTSLLNILSSFIPPGERVATIEDAAELRLQQPHVIRMETRPRNIEGSGEVTIRDLVRNALRMRPDRVIVGECRGEEALDMLQAMNTGHDGSLTTIHANNPRDAVGRLEMMVGMAGFDVPIWTIRKQIASALDLVVQSVRLTGGARKITCISEITGVEGDVLTMHDIFKFVQTGVDDDRRAIGYFQATGIRPNCLERLETSGLTLPPELFEERILKTQEDSE